jgi:hypothetical protein
MGSPVIWIIFLVLPIAGGVAVAITQKPELVASINNMSGWWYRHYLSVKDKEGLIVGIWRWLIWGFHKLHKWTEGVENEAHRAGVRVALFFGIGAVSVLVIATLIYVAVILALFAIGIWVVSMILGGNDDNRPTRSYDAPSTARRGRSRRRKDWLGEDYVEHVDEDGRPGGESRVRKTWLGEEYVERRNADGDVVETSRSERDWLGDEYTEHRNADGDRTGESRDRRDWLGEDYVEHRDADNRERGRSRNRRDWLGDPYTEHEPRD